MNYSNISTLVKQMLLKIHDDIYKKINQNYIDVFLCGGVSSSRNISVRDIIQRIGKEERNQNFISRRVIHGDIK